MNRNSTTITRSNTSLSYRPGLSKEHISFLSDQTYSYRRKKVEGYETRLYYEYLDCSRQHGKAFFYTLTYNDAHIPHYLGHPCFNYDDIRYLTHGGFEKKLKRNYGYKLRYFIAGEYGEGAGKRGLHNNPHYHCIFFLYPIREDAFIDAYQFREEVLTYWQGAVYIDYKKARFGIAKPGTLNLGEMTDQRAATYCAKYVTKDTQCKKIEYEINYDQYDRFYSHYYHCDASYREYCFALYDKCKDYNGQSVEDFVARRLDEGRSANPARVSLTQDTFKALAIYSNSDYEDFCSKKAEEYVKECIRVFRNKHSNKVRISSGLGLYGLEFVNKDTLTIPYVGNKGYIQRPIGMYYYRKIMYKSHYVDGQTYYRLSEFGYNYKLSKLDDTLTQYKAKFIEKCLICEQLGYLKCSKLLDDNHKDNYITLADFSTKVCNQFYTRDAKGIYAYYTLFAGDTLIDPNSCSRVLTEHGLRYAYIEMLKHSMVAPVAIECDNIDIRNHQLYETYQPFSMLEPIRENLGVFRFVDSVYDVLTYHRDLDNMQKQEERDRLRATLRPLKVKL